MNTKPGAFVRSTLALGVASALLALSATSVQAATFDFDDVEVVFDSTFSYGASWRAEDRDWDTISKVNHPRFNWTGYTAFANPPLYTSQQIWSQPGAYSSNGDAGNLNYDRGDMFSEVFRGTHELSIKKDDFGFFGRFTYFYDSALMDEEGAYTNPLSMKKVDPCADDDAKALACRDLRLLDAYIYGNFALNDGANPLSVRIGNQVLSWGESTFIPHGINITPVDVGVLRSPGADLKEAFIPVGMAWASLGLTENLTAEAFYQYEWKNSYLPVPGTYFSTNDFAGKGGYEQNIQLGFAGNPDIDLDFLVKEMNNLSQLAPGLLAALANPAAPAAAKAAAVNAMLAYSTKVTLRPQGSAGEIEPEDGGQYGVKFEYFSPELNDTEFAVYHMNYHSRTPLISGIASNFGTKDPVTGAPRLEGVAQSLQYLAANVGGITKENIGNLSVFSKGLIEYPEDIKLYGFSFNTTLDGTSVAGELSYRQDEPLQIDDVEILYAGMPEQLANSGLATGAPLEGISQIGRFDGKKVQPGEFAQGYILSDTTQAQVTVTHLFGPMWIADNFTMLAEVGGIKINDMPDPSVLRLNGPNTDRSGGPLFGTINGGPLVNKDGVHTALSNGAETNPFPTASAWGYRLLAKADFNDVFAGVNMSHRVVFSHDVNGITPDPLFMFSKDKKSVGYTVAFDYLNRWSSEFSYNAFWGGVGTTNNTADRDFVSFNIKYSI
ncbi:DUF1302 domain-containing protein [Rheinheimera sediminis]|uniref:DUF1302 domain-containing protein n=1 Tax=Rheinheimera sp. YQF-1 TaxID=2499626 RepID=UPI000FDB14B6|nr:DUF1302 domain-containing protein [Rheinheimera sp. YQF-1]RVT47346.1 DUF1302 domain-containing protein [Rheinheimera sp. YQF-1]